MKYFVYCRKSTDREDRQILGTDAKKRLLLEHAARLGLTVADVYVEVGAVLEVEGHRLRGRA